MINFERKSEKNKLPEGTDPRVPGCSLVACPTPEDPPCPLIVGTTLAD